MKILLIMDPGIPVPPTLYGGIERVVYLLAEEYIKLGHDVTLLAGPDSDCSGQTIIFGVNDLNRSKAARNKEILFVWKYLYRNHQAFDVIHNFGRLIYLLPVVKSRVCKVMSYQRDISAEGIKIISALSARNLIFTACSNYCVSTGNVAGTWKTVYNAIDFLKYQLNEHVDNNAPLIFLGRIERIKGAHTAVKVAIKTGNKLIIAGNIPPDAHDYFETEIKPFVDNIQIKYVGAVNDAEKNVFLRQSKALLFPIEWDEPFGIVMIEAMACGTPVIGFKRGAVPEVVTNETGIRINTYEEMLVAVEQINGINRKKCREIAQARFDASTIACEYLNLIKSR
ncbi:glycosyltransferase [Mucilaginibacter sp. L3T2-6]|uniref:glycosyltransferase n=1 Tax=Mucilaginibacter sp. L3T2-6 TaxID=3062491 RepID=UPI0026767393|nr:glycosyltransferase [Mucilaginibacter sp. L3T2-6]MDO3643062.1 glycosyltransferase [Mucilaginibacter sp. L3T2-6]MDV6215829.1 glycosyltransferase [Mucilaginibacter sp. L3T2-6]